MAKKLNDAQERFGGPVPVKSDKFLTDREIFEMLSENIMRMAQGIIDPEGTKAQIFLSEIRAALMDTAKRIVDKLPEL